MLVKVDTMPYLNNILLKQFCIDVLCEIKQLEFTLYVKSVLNLKVMLLWLVYLTCLTVSQLILMAFISIFFFLRCLVLSL